MKRLFGFLRHYKLFSVGLLTIIVGLILELFKQHVVAHWLLGIVSLIEVLPLAWSKWQEVRSGRYGIDILAATAIVTSVILGQYWTAIVVAIMLTGGEVLENFAGRRAKTGLNALLENAPRMAHVVRKGKPLDVSVSQLKANDLVLINSSEPVPADAIITEGSSTFDESLLTGESLPAAMQVGNQVLSGPVNLGAPVTARVTKPAEDSQYQQIIKLVRGAGVAQTPFVRLADRYNLPFTLLSFGIGLGVWVLSGQAIRFLDVIVVATPTTLLLAAPLAIKNGMSRASRYGIIVKTGSALERLAKARAIAFNKSGTLTRGNLVVNEVINFGTYGQDELLQLAAGLEQNSNHGVGRAIVKAAAAQQLKLVKVKHVQETPGQGLKAMQKGSEIIIGRLGYLEGLGVALPAKLKPGKIKSTAAYIAINGELAGVITLKDEVRPEAKATLDRLAELGLPETHILTGDNQEATQAVAAALGIKSIHAAMLPADKIHTLERIEHRPVAYVGDGVKDAPALMAADVGIALDARGSTAASESANIVIMLGDLSRVAMAFAIAKRTFKIARRTILIGIGLSFGLMLIFATGKFSPLLGAFIQEVVDVFVIFNALRAYN